MKPFRVGERIHTFLAWNVQAQESELGDPECSEETRTVLDAMKMVFDKRRTTFERTAPKREPDVQFVGATSTGFGPNFVDWRSQLPLHHPVRQIGCPVIENGSQEAQDQLLAAHNALQAAMRTASTLQYE